MVPESIQIDLGVKERGMGGSLGMIRILSIVIYELRGGWKMWRMYGRGEEYARAIQIDGSRRLEAGARQARKGDLDMGIYRVGLRGMRLLRESQVW